MKLSTFECVEGAWSTPLAELQHMDSENTLLLLFFDQRLDNVETLIGEATKFFPESKIMGGSTSGEIFGTEVKDKSITGCLLQLEKGTVWHTRGNLSNFNNSTGVATHLANQLSQHATKINMPLKGVFVLSDGVKLNGAEVVDGFNQALPGVNVTGGAMGDGERFEKTVTLFQNEICSDELVAVAFYGDSLDIRNGSEGGWDVFGPERIVTQSAGNYICEFDGKPALDLYKKYLGNLASGLPATALFFPIGVINEDGSHLVRTMTGVDEEKNAVILVDAVKQGSRVQLMKANLERLIDGAYQAADMTNSANLPDDQPTLCLSVSCVGRLLVLKGRVEEELEATLEALPGNTQQIGFYSYGEISPMGGVCQLHNQTMTITTIRENMD